VQVSTSAAGRDLNRSLRIQAIGSDRRDVVRVNSWSTFLTRSSCCTTGGMSRSLYEGRGGAPK
jgi:hypothetical protein